MSTMSPEWHDLLFAVRRCIRYHRKREHFFDMWGKWTSGLNIIFGSTAAASVVSASGFLTPHYEGSAKLVGAIAGVIVAIISTVDVIVGSSTTARDHSDLARRFIDLERDMTMVSVESEAALREFIAKRLTIEADEPDVMRMLDVMCHNDVARAEGQPNEHMFKIGWFKRRFAQVVNFDVQGLKSLPPGSPARKQLPA